ncbi:class I SAM-dependent methyltransferase [Aliirhizobium smilacinae]|uniref:Methyltransferase domain-containing protein n=1 Tax=Aliirhizobium smilacinae TaxID=1395944 RepID=A0A5C4X8E2_9HYPH|nr:class I SAM-dependent methyltransferase [Rhizobium smilacinae]TNM59723.1 methyltransferase domain-containing protein [Rhizobium smilacinae]
MGGFPVFYELRTGERRLNGPAYITDIAYVPRFHREHSPAWLVATLTALGFASPPIRGSRWCEIGCGDGFGACLLAAANPDAHFTGIDINPAHIEAARRLASEARLGNIEFHLLDIADDRRKAAPFEFIVAHGIYSWVAPHTRNAIMRFAAQSIAPGGVFYLHYMTQPGAAPFSLFQSIFRQMVAAENGHVERGIRAGLDLLARLKATNAGFFVAHPAAAATLDHLAKEDVAYIAHEYLNDHFAPLHVAEVMQAAAGMGLRLVGSATPIENIDALSVPGSVMPVVQDVKDSVLRETLKDAARNQALRRDLYMRDPKPLDPARHTAALNDMVFGLLPGGPVSGPLTIDTRIGPIELPAAHVAPLLSRLSKGPASFAQTQHAEPSPVPTGLLNQILHALMGAGIVHPLPGMAIDTAACDRLNAILVERIRNGAKVPALAALEMGSGLPLWRAEP